MQKKLKESIQALVKEAKGLSLLYVEDEKELQNRMLTFFSKIFTYIDTANDGKEALEKYQKNRYDIIITDILMPKMNGLELIKSIHAENEKQEIIITSAYDDLNYLMESIKLGVTGYLLKPLNFQDIISVLEQSIDKINLRHENEIYKKNLEDMLQKRSSEVLGLKNKQIINYEYAINSFVKMIERRDTYTGGHSERVARYSRLIAQELGLSVDECDTIYQAGILHDIGKIITPDSILLKPGKLTQNEYVLIQEHVTVGYEILSEVPMYKHLAHIVHTHHEHYDGSGYPKGLKAKGISLA
ncbi:MAG: response regulator, partial [Campylobacterota bacterium]|nr:response regulator [Campylobacterota bacterium]